MRENSVGLHSSTHEFLSCENSSVPATTSWLTKPLGHLDYQLRRSYLLYCSDDMCSVTSVSSSTICGPHAILENYEEYADKNCKHKNSQHRRWKFWDRPSERSGGRTPRQTTHRGATAAHIARDGKKLCPPSYSSPSPLWTYDQYACTDSTTV